eukprot:jgi/Mesen1/1536/ME000133S00550
MNQLMKDGWKKPLEQDDLPPLPSFDDAKIVSIHFAQVWEQERQRAKPSLARALFSAFWVRFLIGGVLQLISIALQLLPSAETALIEVVYHKSLRLSNSARQAKSVGEIVTLMQVDTDKVMQTTPFLHTLWSAPLQVVGYLALLLYYLGWTALTGFALLLVTVPSQSRLVHQLMAMQRKIMLNTSRRVKVINEVLQGMRVVKAYAWERPFKSAVTDIRGFAHKSRAKELKAMRRRVYLRAVQSCLMFATPFVIMLVTFAFYAGVQHKRMDAAIVFTAVSLFTGMRMPLMMYPFVLNAVLSGHVSIVRLSKLLFGEELKEADRAVDDGSVDVVLSVTDSSFSWSLGADAKEKDKSSKSKKKSTMEHTVSFGPGGPTFKEVVHSKTARLGRMLSGQLSMTRTKSKKKAGGKGKGKGELAVDGDTKAAFGLAGISLAVERGQLVAVVGPVGSGKSSLAAALLGEMDQSRGERVAVRGSIAYCAQQRKLMGGGPGARKQAWIMNASLRENILFGHEMDEERYRAVLSACALDQDLEALPDGDMTEIGERGINLSGGQKQRVSLARAVYFDADIYVLDDPLSAVDAHVGAHLFERCIHGILAAKTRVFITNQLTRSAPPPGFRGNITTSRSSSRRSSSRTTPSPPLLPVLMQDQGEFAQLMKDSGSSSVTAQQEQQQQGEEEEEEEASKASAPPPAVGPKKQLQPALSKAVLRGQGPAPTNFTKKGALVEKEYRARGMLSLQVYKRYWTEASTVVPVLVLVLYALVQAVDAYQRYWLAYWTKDQFDQSTGFYLSMYGALAGVYTVMVYFRTLGQALLGLWISRLLHEGMLDSILRAPMAFFDVTPVGRVLNRFSADQSNVDETLPFSWSMFLNISFQVLGTIIVICIVTPIFCAVMVPMMCLYFYIQQIYRRTARELKRLDAVSKSPVYQQFTETLNGLPTIRAYGQQERFLRMCDAKLDANNRAFFLLRCCDRWLSVRLELMGNLMVAAAAFLAVAKRGSLFAGYAGISIGYALQITGSLSMLVRQMTDTENQMNGVERMLEYRDRIQQEAPEVVEEQQPPKDWPDRGAIVFDRVSMRYREGLPLVLREVSVAVAGGERVGVVGRTGSGKSSLMQCLFRLVEPEAGGRVLIDGVDILKIGLLDLRARLSIIPQDPILFSGTVRSNLDPFRAHSDADIWQALEHAHLKGKVAGLPGKLEAEVVEYGENLSVGERQLLCLARVLLRRSRILVMDEATSSVDFETDRLIQATIRAHLRDTTMLIIAHRINTVIDASRILVLADGEVAEYGTPAELLDTPGSKFAALVQDTGEQTAEHLRKVAKGEIDFFATYSSKISPALTTVIEAPADDAIPLTVEAEPEDSTADRSTARTTAASPSPDALLSGTSEEDEQSKGRDDEERR